MSQTDSVCKCTDKCKLCNAFKIALENRKFEIELYWKRTAYFWVFVSLAFTGYIYCYSNCNESLERPFILCIIAAIGIILAFAWCFANKGSKYWQEHWEYIIYQLENEFAGSIMEIDSCYYEGAKTNKDDWSRKRYSVSKINTCISIFVIIIWALLFLYAILLLFRDLKCGDVYLTYFFAIIMVALTIAAVMIMRCKSSHNNKPLKRDRDFIKDLLAE